MWSRIKTTLLMQFIRDVPHELAACEFGCKVGECSQGKWERWERRTIFATARRIRSIIRPDTKRAGEVREIE
jgi:hypothetical protein